MLLSCGLFTGPDVTVRVQSVDKPLTDFKDVVAAAAHPQKDRGQGEVLPSEEKPKVAVCVHCKHAQNVPASPARATADEGLPRRPGAYTYARSPISLCR